MHEHGTQLDIYEELENKKIHIAAIQETQIKNDFETKQFYKDLEIKYNSRKHKGGVDSN